MDKKSCAAKLTLDSVKNKQMRKIILDQQLHVPQKSKYMECFHNNVRMTAYGITMWVLE